MCERMMINNSNPYTLNKCFVRKDYMELFMEEYIKQYVKYILNSLIECIKLIEDS